MAFRMGQDLGLQRDPTLWGRPVQSAAIYFFDEEFRRRIYWGCFLSDKYGNFWLKIVLTCLYLTLSGFLVSSLDGQHSCMKTMLMLTQVSLCRKCSTMHAYIYTY